MINLVVCADDFGISKESNRAILNLARLKKISAVSVLILGNGFHEVDAQNLKPFSKSIDIGLHLWIPDLAYSEILKGIYLRKLNITFFKEHFEHQIQQFIEFFGFFPDFIDGHYHIHHLPLCKNALLEICKKNSNHEFYVRNTHSRISDILKRRASVLKNTLIAHYGKKLKIDLNSHAVPTNFDFIGPYDYANGATCAQAFDRYLNTVKHSNTLFNIHPAVNLAAHAPQESFQEGELTPTQRFAEYDYFVSDIIDRRLSQFNLKIGRFQHRASTSTHLNPA